MCSPVKTVERKLPRRLLLYYITDRTQFAGSSEEKEHRLLEKISECTAADVDFIQLREKDLSTNELQRLARKARAAIPDRSSTKLLISSRTDIALAVGAHGVHLPAKDLRPSDVRAIMMRAGAMNPVIVVSAHTLEEVALAEAHGADFAVFAPVFEKNGTTNLEGLDRLRQVCRRPDAAEPPMPVLALGGVSLQNAQKCVAAGASGIAGIRLFQNHAVASIVNAIRGSVLDDCGLRFD